VTGDGKAEMRDLKVARIADGQALVEEGLTPGERIVVSGHYRVQPRGAVEIIEEPHRPATAKVPPAKTPAAKAPAGKGARP
jgi:multidrug efflux system membrane fusion protein